MRKSRPIFLILSYAIFSHSLTFIVEVSLDGAKKRYLTHAYALHLSDLYSLSHKYFPRKVPYPHYQSASQLW